MKIQNLKRGYQQLVFENNKKKQKKILGIGIESIKKELLAKSNIERF